MAKVIALMYGISEDGLITCIDCLVDLLAKYWRMII